MEHLLPRETLWADKKTMEEFLKEPLNQKLYDTYLNIKRNGVHQDYQTVKLFNEVYYQCSRIVNSEIDEIELHQLIEDIKNDMGWTYSSSLVMNMIYTVLSLRKDNSPSVVGIINKIKEHYRLDKFLTPFAKLVNECAKKNEYYYVDFKGDKSFLQSVLNHVCQMPLGKEKAVSPNIIIQVQQAEINVNCPGNQIIQQQKNDYNKKANSNG